MRLENAGTSNFGGISDKDFFPPEEKDGMKGAIHKPSSSQLPVNTSNYQQNAGLNTSANDHLVMSGGS